MSAEMQLPKLMWLKKHTNTYTRAARFMDLADFLVYRACGRDVRSTCTLVCKWGAYNSKQRLWHEDLLQQVGLGDLVSSGKVGSAVCDPGTFCGHLTAQSALELGLSTSVAVAAGIIDAHAGGIGALTFGGAPSETLALIGGTSTCHMLCTPEARFVPGVWGPYFGAMLPQSWLLEGGQTCSGALLEHIVMSHAAHAELVTQAAAARENIYDFLNRRVEILSRGDPSVTADLHVGPDFLGNRSPLGDPGMRGTIVGRSMDDGSLDALALLYYAAVQALCYTTRDILEVVGVPVRRINACGGLVKNPLWLQEHADVTGCSVFVAQDGVDCMLLGCAVLASVGAGLSASVEEAMRGVAHLNTREIAPRPQYRAYHDKKFAVFKRMQADQMAYRDLMK